MVAEGAEQGIGEDGVAGAGELRLAAGVLVRPLVVGALAGMEAVAAGVLPDEDLGVVGDEGVFEDQEIAAG